MTTTREGDSQMPEPNAEQTEYWNTTGGHTWAESAEPMDRQLAPLGRAAMAALGPLPGEHILDVGCGAGQTSLDLGRAVEPGGEVVGIDLSEPMLAVARRRAAGRTGVRFEAGDAQTFPFAPGAFDAAYSRFGVMFFADPVAAFANLRRALKPGGRLAFACWRTPEENAAFTVPMRAAAPYVPSPPPARDPDAPGPFAFASEERVRGILAAAGFDAVRVAPHDEAVSTGDLDAAVAMALRVGLLGRVLADQPALREVVTPPVRDALAAYAGPDGVRFDAAIWLVTARSATGA
jgi:SAM-dependent methyltransferase